MKIVPVDYNEVKYVHKYKKTKLLEMLETIQREEFACVCIENHEYSSAAVGARTLNVSAKRFNMPHLKAFTREGKIYIVNTLKVDSFG